MPVEITPNFARVLAFLHPKEGVSFEEFDKYWREVHGDIFKSLPVVKRNLTKYEQYHFNKPVNDNLKEMGMYKSPFYGIAVFEAESPEKILEITTDPDYLRIIRPDEEKFFNWRLMEVIAGEIAVFIDKSKGIE